MYRKIEVNAEHNEIILENSNGDIVIIPANKRNWVKQKLSENCHGCIDSLVETLPVASQYAQDGSVYPTGSKVKVNINNKIKEFDISSQEYKDLYNSGKLMNYDKNTDTYLAPDLPEVTVTAEAPQWVKYKNQFEKLNPKSDYIKAYLTPFAKSLGNTETNYPKRIDEEYEEKSLNYASEQLVKNKPQNKLNRVEWLNQMSNKEEELIKRNPKYQSTYWADTKRGLTSLMERQPYETVSNILNNSDFTNREKQEMLKDYVEHPIMSKFGDALKVLSPLNVIPKIAQSAYRDDTTLKGALKGEKNKAGTVEDILTDVTTYTGVGLLGKLSKADKVIDATKAGSKVLNKTDDIVDLYRIQEKDAKTFSQLAAEGKIPKIFNNEKTIAKKAEEEKYFGQWFTKDKADLDWYARDREFTNPEIINLKVPKSKLSQYQNYDKTLSRAPEREFVIPHADQKLYNVDASKAGSKMLNKTDDVIKNLPKLEQIPLDFNIEDVLKNISSTDRKNMEIMKQGNKYFKELDNPESLKRLKEFGDEYEIDLLDVYKKAEKRWDYGKNILKHDKFQVKKTDEEWYGLSTTKRDYEDDLRLYDLEQKFGKDSKEVSDFYKNISQKKSMNYISDVVPLEKYENTIWHELSHDINKSIIDKSPKLQEDIKNIFIERGTADLSKIKKAREYVAKDFYTKKDKILKDLDDPEKLQKIGEEEFDYVTRPTETWAFLSTNLRQDLKNTGIIKNYNEILTPEKLEKAIKNGNTVFSRFEPYIKDKDAFIKLFNKMTLSIVPAALYFQSQNQSKTEQ